MICAVHISRSRVYLLLFMSASGVLYLAIVKNNLSYRCLRNLVVSDTQSDSIQFLNFAKKWFIHYSIQYCFTQDSIQNIIQFKSQGIIDTAQIGKVPKNCPKSVQIRQKRGLFIKNGRYRFKIWFIHSFHDKIHLKGLFDINSFRNIQFKKLFNNRFCPGRFD